MENFGNINNLSAEQESQQEKFAELLDVIDSLSDRLDSNIASEFFGFLEDNDLKLDDYFLARVFKARILKEELPSPDSEYKFYDTQDQKIEKFIMSYAEDGEELALAA